MNTPKVRKTILIVDDEEAILKLFQKLMSHRFERCLTAKNGEESLQILSTEPGIDCVITDISMPVMDGYELMDRLQTLYPTMPVLAVTGHTDEENMQRLRRAGFSRILIKPLDRQKLNGIVDFVDSLD